MSDKSTHPDRPMSADEKPSEELMQLFWGKCTCLDDYTKRKFTDPQCVRCNYENASLLSRCLASRTATGDGALREALELILPLAKGYAPRGQSDTAKATCRRWIEQAEKALSAAPTHDTSKCLSLNLPHLRSVMMQVKVSPMDDAGIHTVYLGKIEVALAVRELEEISVKSPSTHDAMRDAALEEALLRNVIATQLSAKMPRIRAAHGIGII